MRLWIDDLREDPDTKWAGIAEPEGWVWVKSSSDAIAALQDYEFTHVAFDHDLGDDDTTRRVMLWMIENDVWPSERITFHTANPVGLEWLRGTARRYAPEAVSIQ